ncbi:hypothetical protein SAMN05892883_2552 [Jatrophihabitans sp. GAS493]|nr:hypothetical protein SAMN05892883_2552 [Jatrophihabitans sp. GAS493]
MAGTGTIGVVLIVIAAGALLLIALRQGRNKRDE